MRVLRFSIVLLIPAYAVVLFGLWQTDIRHQFQNIQYHAQHEVHSAPIALKVGLRTTQSELSELLGLHGYRQLPNASLAGQWHTSSQGIEIHTRSFHNGLIEQPQRRVRISLKQDRIDSILDLDRHLKLTQIWLEPQRLVGRVRSATRIDSAVALEHVPPGLLAALLAVEDRNYLRHKGFDVRGMMRAAWTNIRSFKLISGGSTLTQQLVKNHFLSADKTFSRKLVEIVIAIILEYHFAKQDLLEAYINTVFLAQSGNLAIHGFALGSQYWFGRPLNELNLAEMALLVGIVKGPTEYSPLLNPDKALSRRNLILGMLHDVGYINRHPYQTLLASALGVVSHPTLGLAMTPVFEALLTDELKQFNDPSQENQIVHTFLDARIQRALEKTVTALLPELERNQPIEAGHLQVAAMVFDRDQGHILAAVADRNPHFPGFNRLMHAKRPIGSLIKPFIVYEALQSGRYTLASRLEDTPIEIQLFQQQKWQPKNFDQVFRVEASVFQTLVQSLNVPAVRLGLDVGLQPIIARLKKLGFSGSIEPVPAILLGALSASPFDVAQLYQPLFNAGERVSLRALSHTQSPHHIQRSSQAPLKVMEPLPLALVNYALNQATLSGTAAAVGRTLHTSALGKTGTTDDYRDSWFIGASGRLVMVVWIGADDNQPVALTGSQGALRLWIHLMKTLEPKQDASATDLSSVEWRTVGARGLPGSTDYCESVVHLPFLPNSLPHQWDCPTP